MELKTILNRVQKHRSFVRGTASDAYYRPALFTNASAAARPMPFDAPVMMMDLVITSRH
jgi:hypothetical protein